MEGLTHATGVALGISAVRRARPLICDAASMRALLQGTKTQARCLVRDAPPNTYEVVPSLLGHRGDLWDFRQFNDNPRALRCPYGATGDQIWCRETWRTYERPIDGTDGICFAADGAFVPIACTREAADRWVVAHDNDSHGSRWRSPINMPRWAARLVLELVDVRVQRLQEISARDAYAEGFTGGDLTVARTQVAEHWDRVHSKQRCREYLQHGDPGYRWDRPWRLVADTSALWTANPWVWALTFQRIL